jgi:hypothetical protein
MIIQYLFCALLLNTYTVASPDSLASKNVLKINMDSLEVLPLPAISGLLHGNSPVDITFEKSFYNLETRSLTLKGMVIDHKENVEIPGVRIIVGSLDTVETDAQIITPRSSVMTNFQGEFTISTKLKKSDILAVVWLGYLEKVYSFKKIGW